MCLERQEQQHETSDGVIAASDIASPLQLPTHASLEHHVTAKQRATARHLLPHVTSLLAAEQAMCAQTGTRCWRDLNGVGMRLLPSRSWPPWSHRQVLVELLPTQAWPCAIALMECRVHAADQADLGNACD